MCHNSSVGIPALAFVPCIVLEEKNGCTVHVVCLLHVLPDYNKLEFIVGDGRNS